MKKHFLEYYNKGEEQIKNIWQDGLITLDANVLLNSYRYSENAREHLFKTLELLNGKLFLTHQAVLEYYKNRINEINRQVDAYDSFNREIGILEERLNKENTHPFISESMHKKIKGVFNELNQELDTSKKQYEELKSNDHIHDKLDEIFRDKVGEPFSDEDNKQHCLDAKSRYENKIPPGYEDNKKTNGREYGDYLLWLQLKEKAKASNKPVIFVTDDSKDDWWWRIEGKTIGPRPEIIREIFNECNVEFHMYSTSRFLKYANEYLNAQDNPKAIKEISEIRKSNEYYHDDQYKKEQEAFDRRVSALKSNFDNAELLTLNVKKADIKEQISILNEKLDSFRNLSTDEKIFDVKQIQKEMQIRVKLIQLRMLHNDISQQIRKLEEES